MTGPTDTRGEFGGAKLAVLSAGHVLTLLRDDRPDIPFPGLWDLPGGGREGSESPLECALREAREELSLDLAPSRIRWRRAYPGVAGEGAVTWFFVAFAGSSGAGDIRLGSEGQAWQWMPVPRFLTCADAVPHLQARLRDFLEVPG